MHDSHKTKKQLIQELEELRKSIASLRKEEETYRLLVENQTDLVIKTDLDGNLQYLNPSCREMFGRRVENLLDTNFMCLVHDDDREAVGRAIEDLRRPPHCCYIQHRVPTKLGLRWMAWAFKMVMDETGDTVANIIGTGRDISERKLAAQDVRESERRLADIINFLPDATFVIDKGGKVIAWNLAMEEMTGVRSEEMVGKEGYAYAIPFYGTRRPLLIDLVLFEDEKIEAEYPMFKRTQNGVVAEVYISTLKGGTYLWGTARALRDSRGEIVGAIESIRDVTDQKNLEETLRESEKKYRQIFEHSIEGRFQSTPQGRYLSVNPALARMAGYDDPDQMMREITDIGRQFYVNPEDRTRIKMIFSEKGYAQAFETQFRRRDGSFFWGEMSARAMRDETGTILYYEGSTADITERKQAEEALRRSERDLAWRNRIANIFLTAPDEEMYGKVLDVVLDIMQSTYGIFGYIGEDGDLIIPSLTRHAWENCRIPGKSVVFPRETWGGLWGRALMEKQSFYSNGPFRVPEGHVPIERFLTVPILYRGSVIGLLSIANKGTDYNDADQDLLKSIVDYIAPILNARLQRDREESARQRAEDAIRNSERRMADIINFLPDATAVIDKDGRVIAWNRAMENMTGVRVEDIVGKDDYEYALPFYGERRPVLADLVLRDDEEIERKYPYIKREDETLITEIYTPLLRGGGHVWATARALRDFRGQIVGAIESLRDVTEQVKAEEALRQSEEKYRLVVEHANDAIFIAQDGMIKFLTPKLSEITGYSTEELKTMHISDLIAPEDRDWVFERHQRRFRGETVPSSYEFRILTKAGEVRWVDINAVLIEWEGRQATLNFIRDITARRQLEAALVHAQKMEAVGTLAGGVAHDFNNLLQGIQGYTELLLLDKTSEDNGFRNLREILNAAGRGAELTRQLLTFSRKVESRLRPVDFNREVFNVSQILQRTIPKMIEIELRLAPNLRRVNADANQIEQVLMNLAVNAKDAMPEGGRLTIETANVTLDEQYCRMHLGANPGEHLLLSVADTGCGMDKEMLEHIFEPFYTTKEVGKGTGLGLAMVYGIVKSHSGYIMCHSEVGAGTTFKIYLPAITDAAEQGEEKKEKPLPGGTETILLVEDEESIRTAGETILSRFGYRVVTAADGETALTTYRRDSKQIDLIILDLIMPGMGGRKCLEKMIEFDPGAKVLIASGHSATGPIRETIESGARGFVSKPYSIREMLTAVRAVLEQE